MQPVKLVFALLFRDPQPLAQAEAALRRRFGPVDFESAPLPFSWTEYYVPEMGEELLRKFLSFRRLIRPERLGRIKHWTMELERELSQDGKRTVNLDPGYLDLARLVLATRKDHAHRVAIGKGLFAEITLLFQRGQFRSLAWTYPDYRSEEYLKILGEIRARYQFQTSHKAASSKRR